MQESCSLRVLHDYDLRKFAAANLRIYGPRPVNAVNESLEKLKTSAKDTAVTLFKLKILLFKDDFHVKN